MPVEMDGPTRAWRSNCGTAPSLTNCGWHIPANAPLLPAPQEDPGRVRNRAFFDKMYGDCKSGQVAPALVPVIWLPKTWGHAVSITSVNGVDRQLAAVSRELDELPAEDKSYLYPVGGTYACRSVADTGQTEHACLGCCHRYQPSLLGLLAVAPPCRYRPRVREPHPFGTS